MSSGGDVGERGSYVRSNEAAGPVIVKVAAFRIETIVYTSGPTAVVIVLLLAKS
jgi:hypothetical protein